MAGDFTTVEVDGRQVRISNPAKVYFSARGETKLDLVGHYLTVGPGALRGVWCRPTVLHRFPDGAEGKSFYQKRVPESRPDWLETAVVAFPSGRTATELCPTDLAHVIWAVNLGCLELHPWAVRRFEPHRPDELRVDLDPAPGLDFDAVRRAAFLLRELLGDFGLVGWPRTSGGRGMHIVVRIVPVAGFSEVRDAALALARAAERRRPDLITSAWGKKDRGRKVFVDYNQNARDRTLASAYSVRPGPDGRVAAPLRWDEVAGAEPGDFTLATMPERWRTAGDVEAALEDRAGSLAPLLALARQDAAQGVADAPWPPHHPRRS